MKNLRKYGTAPFNMAVIHGGPGAPGEMAPVARDLSHDWGVLEPLQTAASLEEQVQELHDVLEKNGDLSVTLIGHSWGAMLSFIFAGSYPSIIKKLILIGSGPYEEKYAANITETRLSRLNERDRSEVHALIETLNNSTVRDKNTPFAQLGKLISRADSYDPLFHDSEVIDYQYQIFLSVWKDAEELRKSGKLLEFGKHIMCPVVAIHGDYDPHPAEGVRKPLSAILDNFRLILLKNCGHMPWIERQARERFYVVLKEELR